MELQGKIKVIGETQSIGYNGFRKRELVLTTEEQYPQHILVEFVQDKTDLLNNFQVGQPIKVGINLRGREWINPQGEAKYFNAIQGWRIENLQQAGTYEKFIFCLRNSFSSSVNNSPLSPFCKNTLSIVFSASMASIIALRPYILVSFSMPQKYTLPMNSKVIKQKSGFIK